MVEAERWFFSPDPDGTITLIIMDDIDYTDAMNAAMQLYPTWVIADQGSYGLIGEFVVLAEDEEE